MFKLASSIGFVLALAELKERIRRIVTQGVLGAIGVVFFLIGFCFLLVALHLYLSALLNPIASAAIVGGVLLLIALILFLVAKFKGASAAQSAPPPRQPRESLAGLSELLGPPESRNQTLLLAGMAVILGFVLGRRSGGDKD